ncbi:hypothetical protein A2U01_0060325 [Trifolium medium]|uniref:Uncharacterized protein n=1 Tax=Trifolium medium TaxID=97028 RepID=A0A392RU44_9FABA|nr:hypothetical protein [Trifolium medium]
MQGSDKVVVDDVREVGQAIGIKFKGDNENMFSALARTGKVKQTASGQTQGGGVRRGRRSVSWWGMMTGIYMMFLVVF